jgi:hypothetical protein
MFYLYETTSNQSKTEFNRRYIVKLFGSLNGLIVRSLRIITPKNQNEEYKWHINLDEVLPKIELVNSSIVIDLKPNTKNNLSLYKIENIYGYSSCGWTPMMFHLKAIFVDDEGSEKDKDNFRLDLSKAENIFTFHHVYDGSVKNGKIIGKWVPPRPSSTNSALMWENTIDYFIECRNILRVK